MAKGPQGWKRPADVIGIPDSLSITSAWPKSWRAIAPHPLHPLMPDFKL